MRFEAWSCTLCFSNCLAGTIFKKFVKYSQQNFGPTPCPKPSPNPCRFLAACNPPIPHSPGSFHSPPGSKFPPGFPCRSEQRFESTSQAWLRRFWGIEGKNGRNWWRKRYESLVKTWEKNECLLLSSNSARETGIRKRSRNLVVSALSRICDSMRMHIICVINECLLTCGSCSG